jgi:hypothetical protein
VRYKNPDAEGDGSTTGGETRLFCLTIKFSARIFRKMNDRSKIPQIDLDKIQIRHKMYLEIKTAWSWRMILFQVCAVKEEEYEHFVNQMPGLWR